MPPDPVAEAVKAAGLADMEAKTRLTQSKSDEQVMKNEVLDDWIRKAEGDFRTARRESKVRIGENFDAVCIFAQQCAEKYLKAMLISSTGAFPRINNVRNRY